MSTDLDALLARAAGDLERQVTGLPDSVLGRVRTRVRRRRRKRHAGESVMAVAGVAVVGAVAWLGATHGTPAPAQSPSVSPTSTPSGTPATPAPTGSAESPTAVADDAAGIARVLSPTTGETWQDPVEDTEMAIRLTGFDGQRAFLVGHRGDASIYVLVNAAWPSSSIEGIYEVVDDQITLVGCPVSADRCSPRVDGAMEQPGVAVDRSIRYESLTVPTAIRVSPTFGVTTTATLGLEYIGVYGDGALLLGTLPLGFEVDGDVRTLRQIGGARLVELRASSSGVVPGLVPIAYAYVTPLGSAYVLNAQDVAAAYTSAFRWDDGVTPPPADEWHVGSTAPGAKQCFVSLLAIEADHVDADWRAAGTAPDGRRVYVPVPGGNAMSRAVFAHERDTSWTVDDEAGEMVEGAAAYPLTEQQFLDRHSLYAIHGPDDEWLLGLRSDADAIVYECA
jgi:hypothetical protein